MSLTDLNMYSLLNDSSNTYMFKEYEDELFNIEHRLKTAMDSGLAPEEFKEAQALQQAVSAAREALHELQD